MFQGNVQFVSVVAMPFTNLSMLQSKAVFGDDVVNVLLRKHFLKPPHSFWQLHNRVLPAVKSRKSHDFQIRKKTIAFLTLKKQNYERAYSVLDLPLHNPRGLKR
ncbi:hypothetical protein CFIMG_007862RA00001 [Ceratocystis fimbriata CBS 114723]|uniref:Uncharacterized protein n=1 Tax=Ceratocystis fimbriata CBS 114723 TaxID=1035309 RepID=A0A2C5WU23_9PEZI|nr:hypothetical protein CFIMG_007862RA00001 [Ceratocystis fimbriata CBS 114723]